MIERPEIALNVRMPRTMMDDLEKLAAETDMTTGQLVREALQRFLTEFREHIGENRNLEGSPSSPDGQVLDRCRQAVSRALSLASDWNTMQGILASDGCEYRAHGGGLAIFDRTDGRYLCKASEVGPGYSLLIKRFRAPFPNHPHTWLADRVLSGAP